MNSSDFTAFAPFEIDLSEAFDTNDLVEGDFGIGVDLDDVLRSPESPFCFFVGESLRLKVKALLRGRSRLVEIPDLSACKGSGSSSAGPSRDLDVWAWTDLDSPMDECDDVALEACGVSSLCMRTKSALTSSFSVRIWAR